MINTIEGNTSAKSGVVANGGGVARKQYDNSYSSIREIVRPNYAPGEAEKVVQEALKWEGYLEKASNAKLEGFTDNAGYNNYNIFAQHAKEKTCSSAFINGAYWCVYFVEDILIRALGVDRAKELITNWTGVCSAMSSGARNAGGKFVERSDAQGGDFVLFWNSKHTDYAHIGLCTNNITAKSSSERVTTNSYPLNVFVSDIQNGLKFPLKQIDGEAGPYTLSHTITVSIGTNRHHAIVQFIQKRLIDLGYSCGSSGADGDYGTSTKSAVIKFQNEVVKPKVGSKYSSDGIISAKGATWKCLLGMM